MNTTTPHRVVRTIARLRDLWLELNYAQRRSLELRTGLSFEKPVRDRIRRAEIQELEALYNLPAAHEDLPERTGAAG